MATIDVDAHVVESEHTWNDMDPPERQYRPILISPHSAPKERQSGASWTPARPAAIGSSMGRAEGWLGRC
jgi:hypothetical protein